MQQKEDDSCYDNMMNSRKKISAKDKMNKALWLT